MQFLVRLQRSILPDHSQRWVTSNMELKIKQQKDRGVESEAKKDPLDLEGRNDVEMPDLVHDVDLREGWSVKMVLLTTASGVRYHFPYFRGEESKAQ